MTTADLTTAISAAYEKHDKMKELVRGLEMASEDLRFLELLVEHFEEGCTLGEALDQQLELVERLQRNLAAMA